MKSSSLSATGISLLAVIALGCSAKDTSVGSNLAGDAGTPQGEEAGQGGADRGVAGSDGPGQAGAGQAGTAEGGAGRGGAEQGGVGQGGALVTRGGAGHGGSSRGGAAPGGAGQGGAGQGGVSEAGALQGGADQGGASVGGTSIGGVLQGGTAGAAEAGQANGGTAQGGASGGQGGSSDPPLCMIPETELTWQFDGGHIMPTYPQSVVSTLNADGFSSVSIMQDSTILHQCEVPLDCPEWAPDLDVISAQWELFWSLTEGDGVHLVGHDARPADGQALLIKAQGRTLTVGEQCDDRPDCTPIPDGIMELRVALGDIKNRALLRCAPECINGPNPALSCLATAEPSWYFGATRCYQEPDCQCVGENCQTGYASQEECTIAYSYCPYFPSCGGISSYACIDDEYCHTQMSLDCGASADIQGVCLPRPRACSAPTATEAVCGCDGRVYASRCMAALDGVGIGDLANCAMSCSTSGDCAGFTDFCAAWAPDTNGNPGEPACVSGSCGCE